MSERDCNNCPARECCKKEIAKACGILLNKDCKIRDLESNVHDIKAQLKANLIGLKAIRNTYSQRNHTLTGLRAMINKQIKASEQTIKGNRP